MLDISRTLNNINLPVLINRKFLSLKELCGVVRLYLTNFVLFHPVHVYVLASHGVHAELLQQILHGHFLACPAWLTRYNVVGYIFTWVLVQWPSYGSCWADSTDQQLSTGLVVSPARVQRIKPSDEELYLLFILVFTAGWVKQSSWFRSTIYPSNYALFIYIYIYSRGRYFF